MAGLAASEIAIHPAHALMIRPKWQCGGTNCLLFYGKTEAYLSLQIGCTESTLDCPCRPAVCGSTGVPLRGNHSVVVVVVVNLRYYDDFDSTSGSEDGAMVDS